MKMATVGPLIKNLVTKEWHHLKGLAGVALLKKCDSLTGLLGFKNLKASEVTLFLLVVDLVVELLASLATCFQPATMSIMD